MNDTAMVIERRAALSSDLLEVRGELDLTNAGSLEDALTDTSTKSVILDLSFLDFLDSAGMRTIDQANRRLAEEGRQMLVVAPVESRAAWTFKVAGYGDAFVVDSMERALARVDGEEGARIESAPRLDAS